MSAGNPRDLSAKQRALRATTAERLEAIVEAAERAAESVIDDAEAQAHRYLAETRERADLEASARLSSLSGLTDSLLAEASALRRQAEQLQATLEEAKAKIEAEHAPPPPEADAVMTPRLRAVALPEEPTFAAEGKRQDPAGARLLATQMAVSGSSREEIELRLRSGFEIEDTRAILDAILGPEE